MKKELIKPNPLRDYIDLSMDVAKMQMFILKHIDAPEEDKERFKKDVFVPLLGRNDERIELLKEINKNTTK